jgi:Mn-dependent DtxR family transcriptional regulator
MEEKDTILKIVKEDILRVMNEKEGSTTSRLIEREIEASPHCIKESLRTLEEEGLLSIKNDFVSLTDTGVKQAADIVKKHLIIEEYFKENKEEEAKAHEKAHILEHYVSREVLNNIKKISTFKMYGIPLKELEFNKAGIITDITLSDYALFERMVSMGICLGERIKVKYSIPDGIVINIGGKSFAVGNEIAKQIEVSRYGYEI